MKRLEVLAGLYKRIYPKGLKMDKLGDRMQLQNTIYLLQAFGFDLGYRFNYYIDWNYKKPLIQWIKDKIKRWKQWLQN